MDLLQAFGLLVAALFAFLLFNSRTRIAWRWKKALIASELLSTGSVGSDMLVVHHGGESYFLTVLLPRTVAAYRYPVFLFFMDIGICNVGYQRIVEGDMCRWLLKPLLRESQRISANRMRFSVNPFART